MNTPTSGALFLESINKRFENLKELGDGALRQLNPAALHTSPGPESNAVAVIIKHMHGNMLSRWTDFLTTGGDKPWRNRDGEFECTGEESLQEVLAWWEEGWRVTLGSIGALREEDLTKEVTIRGAALNVVDALLRQLAHYGYHVGQIVYLVRMHQGESWNTLSIAKGASKLYKPTARD